MMHAVSPVVHDEPARTQVQLVSWRAVVLTRGAAAGADFEPTGGLKDRERFGLLFFSPLASRAGDDGGAESGLGGLADGAPRDGGLAPTAMELLLRLSPRIAFLRRAAGVDVASAGADWVM